MSIFKKFRKKAARAAAPSREVQVRRRLLKDCTDLVDKNERIRMLACAFVHIPDGAGLGKVQGRVHRAVIFSTDDAAFLQHVHDSVQHAADTQFPTPENYAGWPSPADPGYGYDLAPHLDNAPTTEWLEFACRGNDQPYYFGLWVTATDTGLGIAPADPWGKTPINGMAVMLLRNIEMICAGTLGITPGPALQAYLQTLPPDVLLRCFNSNGPPQ